jgi:hypothetical protein
MFPIGNFGAELGLADAGDALKPGARLPGKDCHYRHNRNAMSERSHG